MVSRTCYENEASIKSRPASNRGHARDLDVLGEFSDALLFGTVCLLWFTILWRTSFLLRRSKYSQTHTPFVVDPHQKMSSVSFETGRSTNHSKAKRTRMKLEWIQTGSVSYKESRTFNNLNSIINYSSFMWVSVKVKFKLLSLSNPLIAISSHTYFLDQN